jgi:iron complex transport system substrate-binding protein
MKTKNKMVALVEIAIVLCSVFLVAIPGIAAEQASQEVSAASTSEVTTASEDDYVLGIYGNANEDDTIDMRDITYVKMIFFGKKPETELADAKYDGKINPLDFIQIKLIIVGKEKELTVIDSVDRIVTLDMPIESIIVTDDNQAEFIRLLGEEEKVVGIEGSIPDRGYFPVMSDKPDIGSQYRGLNYELIAELNPDIVILLGTHPATVWAAVEKLNEIGVKAVSVETIRFEDRPSAIMLLGYILEKTEKVTGYMEWREDKLNFIRERLEDLEEEDKPEMLFESINFGIVYGRDLVMGKAIEMAGLRNIADFSGMRDVDPEWILIKNPDIILLGDWTSKYVGYKVTSTSKAEEAMEEEIDRPGFDKITAVKNGEVYVIDYMLLGTRADIGILYLAKIAHPDRFKDIDPVEIHKEYFEKWLRVEYQGIFLYPCPWKEEAI